MVLNGLPIAFGANNGTMSPTSVNLASLMATSIYTNETCPDSVPDMVSATLDNGIETASVTVQEPPTIGACPANIT